MDANWRPTQGSNPAAGGGVDLNAPAAGGDWRAQLQPEERSRIVYRMKDLPLPVSLNELHGIGVKIEENIYSVATDHSDYWWKISRRMLSVETETQQAPGNAQVILNQNYPAQGHAGAGDWQEEIYQMINSLKDQHFAELDELFNKISVKLDSIIPPQMPSELYERMKSFKHMLGRVLQILQISKNDIQPALRDQVPQYEKKIISILNARRRKPMQPQESGRQAPDSNISQQ